MRQSMMALEATGGIKGGAVVATVLALTSIGCQDAPAGPTQVTVDYAAVHQTIEGFGAAGAYDADQLADFGKVTPAIYDDLFGTRASGHGLGLNILRLRNTYQQTGDTNLAGAATVAVAGKARNPDLKIALAAWSPPASLKSNGDINNGGTIIKSGSSYDYATYAAWWADSLTVGWAGAGVTADSISLQNEPDIATSYDSCIFTPSETAKYAGYNSAFDAVHDALAARVPATLPVMPKLIGPESIGYELGPSDLSASRGARDYIDKLTSAGKANIYAYGIHPYADGGGGSAGWDNPDDHLGSMRNFAADPRYSDKPVWMTEYCRLDSGPMFDQAVKLAWQIHNFLVEMKATVYVHFPLFREASISNGGMVNFDNLANTYEIRDIYRFFKHYSYFVDPGWSLVGATTNAGNLRVTAFKDPDGHKLTVVILNKSSETTETFPLTVNGFSAASSQVVRSSESEHWVAQPSYTSGDSLSVPPLSIVTLVFSDS